MTASGPRSQARRFHMGVGPDDLLGFLFRPLVSRCDRFRFRRPGKLSGPPPFTASLNVQRDDAHNNSGFGCFALNRQTASQNRGSGDGHNCVPNKGRADFPPVLKSGHTIAVVRWALRLMWECCAFQGRGLISTDRPGDSRSNQRAS
jgi:hypothetical protein